ncbi:MAG: T9SS type A sorting domain-containing protein, partial [Bacteroidetes bacterium]|nr:T9SS type A sorting domain-containing protein [Bacteroidota bacterium]
STDIELGENSIILKTEDLAKGVYFIEISNREETIFKKFMKQ